jgi:hypothetical protein
LQKLIALVNEPEYKSFIRWSDDGSSVFIPSKRQFQTKILPIYFDTALWGSFLRQLNMYDFYQVNTPNKQERVFSNPFFTRNEPELVLQLTRKTNRGPRPERRSQARVSHPRYVRNKIHSESEHEELRDEKTESEYSDDGDAEYKIPAKR